MDSTASMSKIAATEDKETLWLAASEEYIRGEISAEEFKQIESLCSSEATKDTDTPSVLDFLKDVLTQPFR